VDSFSLFATPLVVFDVPGIDNQKVTQILLAERAAQPGIARSNVVGWHSTPNLSQRAEPCIVGLMEAIVQHVGQLVGVLAHGVGVTALPPYRYGVQGWAMILGDGDYVQVHDHGESHWSTVYYVDAGEEGKNAESGKIAFIDPRHGGRPAPGLDLFPSTFTIMPRTGALVIFPGWLQHYVHAYRGARPRISISCNVVMETAW
jgi:uncharacterized protein (TIGR02466 family)